MNFEITKMPSWMQGELIMQEVKRKRGGNVKKAPPGFYTSQEARERLDIKPSAFQKMVTKGEIERIVPPLQSEGFYRIEDINKLANRDALFYLQTISTDQVPLELGWATEEDIQGIFEAVASLWGAENATPVEHHRILWRANPYIDYVVKFRGLVLGYINATPYIPETLQAIMEGRKRGIDLGLRDVLRYEPGNAYDVYVGIVIRQDIPRHEFFGERLILGFFKALCKLAEENITIRKMYAISDQDRSIKISRRLGFEEDLLHPGRFILDTDKANSVLMRNYREVVNETKSNQLPQIKPKSYFSVANIEDIPAIADIDERTFNAHKETAEPKEKYIPWIEEIYLRWLQKNPEAFFVLRNEVDKVVGFASLVSIKKQTMDRFVKGEIGMGEIPLEDIDLFESGKPIHLYVIALCVDPLYKRSKKVAYGAQLIENLFDFLLDLARRGVEIETITARNDKDKPDGRNLLHKMGIPQLRSPVPSMYLFSVRVADSGYPKLVQYSDTLAEWKREHALSQKGQ